MDEAAAFFGRWVIWDPKAFRSGTGECLRRARIRACRRGRLEATGAEGTNEVMPSMMA